MVNNTLRSPVGEAAVQTGLGKSDKFQVGRAVNWIVAAGNDCRLT
jgi:hypothetical protein